jgi:hypothetical protein
MHSDIGTDWIENNVGSTRDTKNSKRRGFYSQNVQKSIIKQNRSLDPILTHLRLGLFTSLLTRPARVGSGCGARDTLARGHQGDDSRDQRKNEGDPRSDGQDSHYNNVLARCMRSIYSARTIQLRPVDPREPK